MGKPVAGEVVIIPFPQTDMVVGKRRPALVLADLPEPERKRMIFERFHGESFPLQKSKEFVEKGAEVYAKA